MRRFDLSWLQSIGKNERGQIVFEYVLLLVLGVGLALVLTSTMVSRSADSPGFVVAKWFQIIQTIGSDHADDLENAGGTNP